MQKKSIISVQEWDSRFLGDFRITKYHTAIPSKNNPSETSPSSTAFQRPNTRRKITEMEKIIGAPSHTLKGRAV